MPVTTKQNKHVLTSFKTKYRMKRNKSPHEAAARMLHVGNWYLIHPDSLLQGEHLNCLCTDVIGESLIYLKCGKDYGQSLPLGGHKAKANSFLLPCLHVYLNARTTEKNRK